jgi:metal-responsive CopG/Arc/MetJ family transcriptional regulator
MKQKISITLSNEVLESIDQLAGSKQSRSAFVERIIRRYLRDRVRAALHARDLERLNRSANRLNQEAADVLEYQSSE